MQQDIQARPSVETSQSIRKQIRGLCELDNWHVFWYLFCDYGMIVGCVALCTQISYGFYPVAWLLIGTRQRGLANLLHAASHNTLAKSKRLNFILGTVFSGYLIGQLFVKYSHSHVVNHHGSLGDEAKDPDYLQTIALGFYNQRTRTAFFRKYVYRSLFGLNIPVYIRYVAKDRFFGAVPAQYNNRIVSCKTDTLLFLLTWAFVIAALASLDHLRWLVVFWLVPLFSSAMIVGWFIELAEHFPLVRSKSRPLYMSRNRHGNLFERFLCGVHYDHYHLEHHLNPRVPMWQLHRSNEIRLQDPEYRDWDSRWGGIFSKRYSNPERRTFIQYLRSDDAKYLAASDRTPGLGQVAGEKP
ncbi:fatty acid desaturase [Salinisphaera sp. RV14]|uniref:fatty acid desaturase n=1 Tax=Salinisphaera sp. RV14 TaxID=3454140 RepID=UPI003F844B40